MSLTFGARGTGGTRFMDSTSGQKQEKEECAGNFFSSGGIKEKREKKAG